MRMYSIKICQSRFHTCQAKFESLSTSSPVYKPHFKAPAIVLIAVLAVKPVQVYWIGGMSATWHTWNVNLLKPIKEHINIGSPFQVVLLLTADEVFPRIHSLSITLAHSRLSANHFSDRREQRVTQANIVKTPEKVIMLDLRSIIAIISDKLEKQYNIELDKLYH